MHHRSMWVAFYLLQASECLDPEQLEIVSPHLMSMDTAIFELLTDHCPKEAKSELDNFIKVRRRKLFSNTRGIALLCLVVQTLRCSMPGKPEQRLESVSLNLSALCEDVTSFSESLDEINTQFEQHGPDAAECERLCEPVVNILLQKGTVAKDIHYIRCYEAMTRVPNENYLTKMHVFQGKAREHKQDVQNLNKTIRLQCEAELQNTNVQHLI